MSITSLSDWGKVELAAQTAELANVTTYKIPVDSPTVAQQLLWATTELANAKSRIYRLQSGVSQAMMWLAAGATQRAQEELSRVILDI